MISKTSQQKKTYATLTGHLPQTLDGNGIFIHMNGLNLWDQCWQIFHTVDGRNPANHLLSMKPCEKWDILHINWCRISSINSTFASFWGTRFKCPSHGVPPQKFGAQCGEILASQKGKHRFQTVSRIVVSNQVGRVGMRIS